MESSFHSCRLMKIERSRVRGREGKSWSPFESRAKRQKSKKITVKRTFNARQSRIKYSSSPHSMHFQVRWKVFNTLQLIETSPFENEEAVFEVLYSWMKLKIETLSILLKIYSLFFNRFLTNHLQMKNYIDWPLLNLSFKILWIYIIVIKKFKRCNVPECIIHFNPTVS